MHTENTVSRQTSVPGEAVKGRLERAVLEVFSNEDFHRANMRTIAQKAGVGLATIYRHFESKEDLLFFFVDEWLSGFFERMVDHLQGIAGAKERLRKIFWLHLDYFEKNRDRMRYRYFREHGYVIGSGVVEAACKTIVGQRFKGAGMHWSLQGLMRLLAIRTALCSNRYDDFWAWRASKLKPAA